MASAVTTIAAVDVPFTEICTCASCDGRLVAAPPSAVACVDCGMSYPIQNGVLHLLTASTSDVEERYRDNYQQIATADLANPFEENRAARHATLLRFIGDVCGKRVLDIGSSNAGYLRLLRGASQRVAMDLAAPFLEAIPEETGILRVRADAEVLPFRPGAFDVVVIADVLEHLLEPEKLVSRLTRMVNRDTRVIVHVPWEEDITTYRDSEWEFTHLRSFTYYTFLRLWNNYRIVRERSSYPALEEPYVFAIRRFVPLWVFNVLSWTYFHAGYAQKEYERRAEWIKGLPAREAWLLKAYRPLFKMFELRLLDADMRRGGYAVPLPRPIGRIVQWLSRT
jgi:SAM-dependent methyltransferase